MTTINVREFIGELPSRIPRYLPENAAQRAFDVRLTDGGLTPTRMPAFAFGLPAPSGEKYKSIYLHQDQWYAWETIVNAAPGPVADDRLYLTGDGVPKLIVDGVARPLALNAPTAALSGAATGAATSPDITTIFYSYTFVTDLGEESQPALLSNEISWRPGQSVLLSGFQLGQNDRGIVKQRIYRSQTTISGQGALFLIAERASSLASYTDIVDLDDFGAAVTTTNYDPPPDDMFGLIALPNGMMAACSGKKVMFCEPYLPHAWPAEYAIPLDFLLVGLGAYSTSMVALTKGNPYIIGGTSPINMISEKLELNLPCINRQTIVDLGYTIAYGSTDGLVTVTNGVPVLQDQLFTRQQWRQLNPEIMVSGQYDGRYFGTYRYIDIIGIERKGCIIMDLSGAQPYIIRTNLLPDAWHYDIETGGLYFVDGNEISLYDADGQPNSTLNWRSKEYILARPTNLGAIYIEARTGLTAEAEAALAALILQITASNQEVYDSVPFQQPEISGLLNGAVNASAVNAYPVNGDVLQPVPRLDNSVSVAIYGDGALVAVVSTRNRMARLPAGKLYRRYEFDVSSNITIEQIVASTTGAELSLV